MSDINIYLGEPGDMDLTLADEGDINVSIGGTTSFQTLSDTPSSYTGESGKVVTVKSSEDGIEFTTAGEGNVSTSGTPVDNDFAKFIDGTDIEGRSYTEVRTDLNIEDGADVTDATNVALAGAAMSGGAFHDGFSDFVANEHIDWTADQGATNIHSGNYTDTDTTDHTALSNIGTQTHAQLETAIGLNTAKETDVNHNVTTNLSLGTKTATTIDVNSSDGTNATLIEADTTNAGLLGSDKWDEIVVNSLKATNIAHPLVEEAVPSGAVFTDTTYTSSDFTHNSLNGLNDGTDYEHITQTQKTALHSSGADTTLGTMTQDINMNSSYQVVGLQAPAASGEAIRQTTKITEAKMEAADDHVNDNTQAHSDYLLNNASDTTSGTITAAGFTTTGTSSLAVTTVADHGTATTDQVVNVCYGTSATPPTASTTTEGALYVQYTS